MSELLVVQDVSVRFGGLQALDAVSFAVEGGRTTALIGPNGAGKTTCFNVITGFVAGTRGTVHFDGEDITHKPPHRRDRIGRTFQLVELFGDMSVRENVMLGLHPRLRGGLWANGLRPPSLGAQEREVRAEADSALESVGLADLRDRPARTLPLGQQRLVELARAAVRKPRLLLLDEAGSGLDGRELAELVDHISRLREEGVGALLVEHNMRFVRDVAEHLVVLNYGKLIFDGPLAEGMVSPEVTSAYLDPTARVPDEGTHDA